VDCETAPAGPETIDVSGGVLSTRTTRCAVAGLPARSAAVATRVCVPSASVVVSQLAAAVAAGAGRTGAIVATSGCVPRATVSVLRPLLASEAWTWTATTPRTKAPAAGDTNASAGPAPSCVTARSTADDVSPSPRCELTKTSTEFRTSGARTTFTVK